MNRIKIKNPAKLLWNEQNVFVGGFISFQSALTLVVLQLQKKPTGYWRHFHLKCRPLAPIEPVVHAMSVYFKFRAIYFWLLNEYRWWDQATIYYIIRQLSYRFMCEIMTWADDKTKLIHKTVPEDYDYEFLNPKQNENSHHNSEGADAIKPFSEVPRSGTIRNFDRCQTFEKNKIRTVHKEKK